MGAEVATPEVRWRLLIPLAVGGVLAVLMGAYGSVHDPTGRALTTLFFTSTINLKTWFATLALLLATFQLTSALWLYGKILKSRPAPGWLGEAHRLSGTLAFLATLPVAYHCLWALGFDSDTGHTRRFVHSVLGCAFYGAFAAKVIAVRSHRLPQWALPLLGGTVFTILAVLWSTSALWFFRNNGFPSL